MEHIHEVVLTAVYLFRKWDDEMQSPVIALTLTEIGLAVLKVSGIAVGTVSTLWGLTQKLTYDDAEGNKRLTRQGRVSFALAIGSFLVAGAAASVELQGTVSGHASRTRMAWHGDGRRGTGEAPMHQSEQTN